MSCHEPDKQASQTPTAGARLEESHADPHRLALLFQADRELFSAAELGTLLAHQLASPLRFYWPELDDRLTQETAHWPAEARTSYLTFGDLLCHSRPPTALLMLVKDFCKRMLEAPGNAAAAATGQRPVFHGDCRGPAQGARRSRTWMNRACAGHHLGMQQAWVGEPCREILERGLREMDGGAWHE